MRDTVDVVLKLRGSQMVEARGINIAWMSTEFPPYSPWNGVRCCLHIFKSFVRIWYRRYSGGLRISIIFSRASSLRIYLIFEESFYKSIDRPLRVAQESVRIEVRSWYVTPILLSESSTSYRSYDESQNLASEDLSNQLILNLFIWTLMKLPRAASLLTLKMTVL